MFKESMDSYWQITDHMEIWSFWKIKMRYLPNSGIVCTIVWLHRLDFNQTLGEKSKWELHKDTACCFEVAPLKKATVQPLTSHLTNHPSKTNKT